MTTETCADPSFGVNPSAQAILCLLAGTSPDFATSTGVAPYDVDILTYTWVNGRERGASLVVKTRPPGRCLILTFGEDRRSDLLFVEEWEESEEPFNGPTVENRTRAIGEAEAVYKNRRHFSPRDVGSVAEYLYNRMAVWYQTNRKR